MSSSPWSQFREKVSVPSNRTAMISTIFILGIILGLPNPIYFTEFHDKVLMVLLWVLLVLLVWLLFLKSSYVRTVWFLAFVASLMTWWKLDLFIPCVMMGLWALWYQYRERRLKQGS